MQPSLVVITQQLRVSYRDALRADWNAESLPHVAGLVRRTLGSAGVRLGFPWDPVGKENQSVISVGPELWEEMSKFLETLYLGARRPSLAFGSEEESSRRAQEVAALLNAQIIAISRAGIRLEGETGFLKDCQSLLFQLAVHDVVGTLRVSGSRNDFEALIAALQLHVSQVWLDDLPHQAFLAATLASELGFDDGAADAFRFAFRASNSDDHDYLSKAHAVWFTLRDAGRQDEARRFLVQLARSSPPELLDEIQQMVEQEFSTR